MSVGINCNTDEWSDIVAISAGSSQTLGLKADGTVFADGINTSNLNGIGQYSVDDWCDIVFVSAVWGNSVGLTEEGEVIVVRISYYGEDNTSGWSKTPH